jgi:hypothetical protein
LFIKTYVHDCVEIKTWFLNYMINLRLLARLKFIVITIEALFLKLDLSNFLFSEYEMTFLFLFTCFN